MNPTSVNGHLVILKQKIKHITNQLLVKYIQVSFKELMWGWDGGEEDGN